MPCIYSVDDWMLLQGILILTLFWRQLATGRRLLCQGAQGGGGVEPDICSNMALFHNNIITSLYLWVLHLGTCKMSKRENIDLTIAHYHQLWICREAVGTCLCVQSVFSVNFMSEASLSFTHCF